MRRWIRIAAGLLFSVSVADAAELSESSREFLRCYCLHCHGSDTANGLNLEQLKNSFSAEDSLNQWVKLYDRVAQGEMPPATEDRPPAAELASFLSELNSKLVAADRSRIDAEGRVPLRRLTRTEYEHAVRDIFGVSGSFGDLLPQESSGARFDGVAVTQHFSAAHLDAYLQTADRVLDAAMQTDVKSFRSFDFDLPNSAHLNSFHERDLRIGGDISLRTDDGVKIFRDVDYLVRSDQTGFLVRSDGAGVYRVTVTAESVNSERPVAMKLVTKAVSGESELIDAIDLLPGQTHVFEAKVYLDRTTVFYVSMDEERLPVEILGDIMMAGGPEQYRGAGIHIRAMHVEGPLRASPSAQNASQPFSSPGQRQTESDRNTPDSGTSGTGDTPLESAHRIIQQLAEKMFRRPVALADLESFVALTIDSQQLDTHEMLRPPLRAMLASPQFLLFAGPPGPLDDYDLAARLSFFLWKTVPDSRLLSLAKRGQLSQPDVLAEEVDRLLDDRRSRRFLRDFANQWLRLKNLDETTPDEKLYPEYDSLLHWSLSRETEEFLGELIRRDLSASKLIQSDFVMVNRRLAEHYGIDGVVGQNFRRVTLAPESVRGGLMTQAAILKVTANGLTTSPVKRGEFILSELLGTPPPPPPDNVGSIEPDTSGASTVREALERHRDVAACAECHRKIDPPGFALESFDPTGAFRTHYRVNFDEVLSLVKFRQGGAVDASGVSDDGVVFDGIQSFRRQLLERQEAVSRHFIELLIVYATGAEIRFSDRMKVDEIVDRLRNRQFPVRSIIHQVVQSEMFRNR